MDSAASEALAHVVGVIEVKTHYVVVLVDEGGAVPEDGGGELGWDAVEVEECDLERSERNVGLAGRYGA